MPMIRLADPALHKQVKHAAVDAGITVSDLTAAALRQYLASEAKPGRLTAREITRATEPPPVLRTMSPSDLPPRRPITKADSCK